MIRILPCLFVLLSACSQIADIRGALDFRDERDDFRDRVARLEDRSTTAYVAIPDTGTATYRGEAALAVGNDDIGVYLIGDARLTANFEDQTLSGELSNFDGFDRTEEYDDYAGRLTLGNGEIGTDNPNDVAADITGTLRGDDYDIDVDAEWSGEFRGTPIRGILGETSSTNSTFEMNGDVLPGGIVIAVEG